MAPKKYTNGRRKNDGGNEVLGVGIIIAAAFVLLCIVVPPVIGLVSRAVNGIVTGIFGFISYPLFICLLIYGIALAKNVRSSVPGKFIAAIAVAAVCLVLILQLAVTDSALGMDFSEYVSYVYDKKNATAGVFFGILAYGMQAGLSLIFTYILLAAGVIVSVLALFGVFGRVSLRRRTTYKKTPEPQEKRSFEKSGAPAAPVKSVMDNSLYVGTINPAPQPSYISESGSYDSLPEERREPKTLSGYYNEAPYTPPEPAAPPENDRKAEALKILYGDKSNTFSPYGTSGSGSSGYSSPTSSYGLGGYGGYNFGSSYNTTGYGSPVLQSEPVVQHDANAKPPKIVHSDLPEIVYPAEKDISGQLVGGEIINGDALSDTMKRHTGSAERETPPARPADMQKAETEAQPTGQAPIMNGDFFGTDKFRVPGAARMEQDKTPPAAGNRRPAAAPPAENRGGFSDALFAPTGNVAAEHGLPPIYTPDNSYTLPPKVVELEPEPEPAASVRATEPVRETPPPVASAADARAAAARAEAVMDEYTDRDTGRGDSFESLLRDEPTMRQRADTDSVRAATRRDEPDTASAAAIKPPEPSENGSSVRADDRPLDADVSETDDAADDIAEVTDSAAPADSAFDIRDEVEDLSETRVDGGRDYTGYYTKEKSDFETRVGEIDTTLRAKKNKVVPNQINLDDYNRTALDGDEAPKPKRRPRHKYNVPPTDLLLDNSTNPEDYGGDSQEKARILEETLENLKLPAKVSAITKGPAVTRYELEMPPGQSIKKIESFQADIAYNLASNGKIRIETPIPGKRAVGIEVPNEQIAIVALRDIILSKEFQKATSPLTLALGKDIAGQNIVCPLEKMPHLLIAGATNSGKSACLNAIIMSILYKSSPDDVRLILVDPKEVEFRIYRGMPHLLIPEILTDTDQASNAFKWAKEEMDRRYKLLSKYCARNITEFNNSQAVKDGVEDKMYSIVIIVDELAELMLSSSHKEFEDRMTSVAQKRVPRAFI